MLSIDEHIAHRKSACLFQVSYGDDAHYLNEIIERFNSELRFRLIELVVSAIISIMFQALSVKRCCC